MTTKAKAKEKETGQELAPAEAARNRALATYAQDVELSEDIRSDEVQIPFLRIIQSNSPQVDPNSPQYLPQAKQGMIFNTASKDLYSAVVICIAQRMHNFVRYIPRDDGSGFVEIWDASDERIKPLQAKHGQFGKLPIDAGQWNFDKRTELVETYYWAGPVIGKLPDGRSSEMFDAVLGMASTQIKYYKQTMNQLSMCVGKPRRVPDFAFRWLATTMADQNRKGKFWSWKVVLDGESRQDALLPPDDPMVRRGRELAASLREGVVKPDYAAQAATGGADDDGGGAGGDDNDGEEIPM